MSNEHVKQLKHFEIKELRDKILIEQEGICPICKREISDPVLDHAHKRKLGLSGQIRGVLCRTCNVYLGKIENSARRYKIDNKNLSSILRNMADYIDKEQYPYIHPTEKDKKLKLTKKSYNKLKKVMVEFYKDKKMPKIPEYTGNYTKSIEKFFKRFNLNPEFYK